MSRESFKRFDLSALRRDGRIAYYFRYPLHHSDFHELRESGRLLGRFAVKPLFGRLTVGGRVDRSQGYSGELAIVFIPARARSVRSAQVVLARMPRARVATAGGRRNWPAIRAAAGRVLRQRIGLPRSTA